MPFIIVATDFSAVSDNALKYACDMALAQAADIVLLHTYAVPLALGDMAVTLPISDFKDDADKGMGKQLAEIRQQYPQINFRAEVIYGDLIDAINTFTTEEQPVMVVTGNSYTPDNPAWMDATLLEAFRHLRFPVLAIPDDVKYTQVRKIGFVYDNVLKGSKNALAQLARLVQLTGAELHVFYAQTDVHTQDNNSEINAEAREILAVANPLYHYAYESNVDDSILTFVGKYQIDWLVVMPRRHSFFDSLFHKSHTKAIVSTALIPVMALHESEPK